MEQRLDDTGFEGVARTADYRPERDGVANFDKGISLASEPVPVVRAVNFLEQAAHVNDPEDESMMDGYDAIGQLLLDAGKATANYLEGSLGENTDIHGKDRSRPVGHLDQSYGPGIGSPSKNLQPGSAVAGKSGEPLGPANMSYWADWSTEQSRKMPLTFVTDGAKQAINDSKILFLSGTVMAGESLYDLMGGDPTALDKTKKLLDQCQIEAQKNKPLEMKEIYVRDNAEKTMQNITRYLYQELGNQLVRVPAYFLAGKLRTIAELTGASTTYMASKIHADIRSETGESRVGESVMYAVPLGLMSAMLWPLRDAIKFRGPKETMDYVASMVSSVSVHKVQDISKGMVVDRYTSKKPQQEDD